MYLLQQQEHTSVDISSTIELTGMIEPRFNFLDTLRVANHSHCTNYIENFAVFVIIVIFSMVKMNDLIGFVVCDLAVINLL